MLYLIDKSSQFCNIVNKYEEAITCAFGCMFPMSTISAVPTCMANMHVRATLRKYRVLRYLIWFLEEKMQPTVFTRCLESSF